MAAACTMQSMRAAMSAHCSLLQPNRGSEMSPATVVTPGTESGVCRVRQITDRGSIFASSAWPTTPDAPVRKIIFPGAFVIRVDIRYFVLVSSMFFQSGVQEIRSIHDITFTLDWKPTQRASSEGMSGRSLRNHGRSSFAAPSQISADTHWPDATERATP